MSKIGKELSGRLKRFSEELESGDPIGRSFTVKTITLRPPTAKYDARLVKRTRKLLGSSQAIFAEFLGVATNTVQDWEQGLKMPNGSARRLMDEIRTDPEYWIQRLRSLATTRA